jgi:NitT/TauT family transport system permease protein/sulfonate transport system permease protein
MDAAIKKSVFTRLSGLNKALPPMTKFFRQKALWLGAGILLLWESLGRAGLIDAFIIPLPSVFLNTFATMVLDGSLFVDLAASLKRVMVGYLMGAGVGLILGGVLGWWKWGAEALVPLVEALRPIPPIAWIPIAILWFGVGDPPAYFIVFLGAVFPIFTNTFSGVRGVDPAHVYSAQCLGASSWMIVTRVLVPAALPTVMTGMRVGLGVAWMCVVGAELIAARSGLGYMIDWYRQFLRTDVVLVGMGTIGLAGLFSNYVMLALERRLIPWRRDVTEAV